MILKGAETLDEAITAACLAAAAVVEVPNTGDMTMMKDIHNLKAIFVKLVTKF